jgi:hypothetical protein
MMGSTMSKIRWTPFCVVIRPTNENKGIVSSSSLKLKYFIYKSFFAAKWFGAAASSFLILSAIGIPFGKANGFGFYFSNGLSGESLKRSSL